ncbi:hypothetical protein BDN70DRAFT_343936 [Pholiota conissans]|uniref:Uncharacterized protein n=1 Tax=Pholiota conissans TaxID=109636 RepID=A0A9P6CUP2_9AGAR|nr:hypothetical protein BDN70DRAFT_343936 [Pholiota conissans]
MKRNGADYFPTIRHFVMSAISSTSVFLHRRVSLRLVYPLHAHLAKSLRSPASKLANPHPRLGYDPRPHTPPQKRTHPGRSASSSFPSGRFSVHTHFTPTSHHPSSTYMCHVPVMSCLSSPASQYLHIVPSNTPVCVPS